VYSINLIIYFKHTCLVIISYCYLYPSNIKIITAISVSQANTLALVCLGSGRHFDAFIAFLCLGWKIVIMRTRNLFWTISTCWRIIRGCLTLARHRIFGYFRDIFCVVFVSVSLLCVCELVSFPYSPGMVVVLHWSTAFLWQISSMAALVGLWQCMQHTQTLTHNRRRGMCVLLYTILKWKGNNFSRLLPAFFAVATPQGHVLTLYFDEIDEVPWQNGFFLHHKSRDLCLITWPCFGRLRPFLPLTHTFNCTLC